MKRTNPEVWDLTTARTLPTRIIAQRFLWITATAFFAIAEIDRISYKTGPGNLVEKAVLPDDSSPNPLIRISIGQAPVFERWKSHTCEAFSFDLSLHPREHA